MPNIAVDYADLDSRRAGELARAVRDAVVAALPDTETACSCRVRHCAGVRAVSGEGAAAPFAWIEVALFPGRDLEWKRVLYRALVDGCAKVGIEGVSITLREPALENWGIRGGVPASDLIAQSPRGSGRE